MKCKRCPAEIFFAYNPKNMREMPIELAPDGNGNIRVQPAEGTMPILARVLTGRDLAEARASGEALYISHFATCPAAQSFRKKR